MKSFSSKYTLALVVGCLLLIQLMTATLPPAAQAAPAALTPSAQPPTLTPTATLVPTLPPTLPPETPMPTVTPPGLATATPPAPTLPLPSATPIPTLVPPTAIGPSPIPRPGGDNSADVTILKLVNTELAYVGQVIEWTLLVTNNGPAIAYDVTVSDELPAFLSLYYATTTRGLISNQGNSISIYIGEIAVNDVITIRIQTQVLAEAAPPANVNLANVVTSSPGDLPDNNSSSASVRTLLPPTPLVPATATPTATARPGLSPTPTPTLLPGQTPTARPPTPRPAIISPAAGNPPIGLPPTSNDPVLMYSIGILTLSFGLVLLSLIVRQRKLRRRG